MRYIIGCDIKLKPNAVVHGTNCECHGIYACDIFYFLFVLGQNYSNLEKIQIPVFDDLEAAKEYVKGLSKAYRRDDVAWNPSVKSRYIRNFYLLKLDSPKCPIKIDENSRKETRNSTSHKYAFYNLKPSTV